MIMLLTFALHLFRFLVSVSFNFRVRGMVSFPNACLIAARVSGALFPRFAQNLSMLGRYVFGHNWTTQTNRLKLLYILYHM
jgi:hypothetical protein